MGSVARSAEGLHRRAVDLSNRGRFSEARRLLAQATELTEDPDLSARITGTLAYAMARAGEHSEATRLCREALDDPRLHAHTVAILAGQLGSIAEMAGRLDEAERWLTRGLDGLGDDPEARANLLVNRSLINMRRRDLAAAGRDASEATRLFAELGMHVDEAQARHNEGYIALLEGDLIRANQSMLAARATIASLSPISAAISDLDRAEVLRDAGLTTEAEESLRRIARVFGAHRMPQARAEAEFHLARSLLTHDPRQARLVAAGAARRFRAVGNEAWAARSDAVRLRAELAGGRITRRGDRERGRWRPPPADEVAATASALDGAGFASEAAALRMSSVLARARHAGAGDGTTIRVPPRASVEVRLLAHEARAARAAAAGRHAQARAHAAAGLELLTRWQESFGSLDLQTAVTMHGSGLIFSGLSSAVASRRPEQVFEWSERARHLSQQVVPLRPPPDPALASELAEIRMLRADDPAWTSDPRVAELRDRARERQWSRTGAATIEQRATLAEVQARLDAETALIAYVFSGDALSALVVTRDGAFLRAVRDWPLVRGSFAGLRAELDMAATVRDRMGEIVKRSLADRLRVLSDALLQEAVTLADARRLVITVPGVLSGLPWAMLPAMRGRAFTLAPSATRWVRHREPAVAPVRAAAFAAGPRVARAEEEIRAAAAAWPSASVLRGGEATVAAVTALARGADVLHIAAHGRHVADNPMFSGLELADGILLGYDVDLIDDVPPTVVLSACEVGRSSVRWGEEAIGMTRVWLHAGARSVVAAPVVVADDDACELLSAMHDGLAAGVAPSEALAAAAESTGIVAPFQVHGAGFSTSPA
jgi:tetratricopeptide (TPR) repeat protein